MNEEIHTKSTSEIQHGTYRSYIIGFVLSVALTLAAYFLVVEHVFTGWALDGVIVALSVVQVFVQLIFFLHLMEEAKPRNNMLVFWFMVLVIAILVLGTLWIMSNLDYRMMPQMNTMTME